MANSANAAVPAVSPSLTVPATIDYTSKDYLGLVSSMLGFAGTVMPDWNASSEGDLGVALVELFGYAGDILSYYGDRISTEAYLPTATQRLSLLNISQLLGYTPSNGAAAYGQVTFQTSNPGAAVLVPAGTQVATNFNTSTDAPVIYEVDAGQSNYTVPGNGGTLTLNVTQGETYTLVPLGTSTGLPGQEFQIPQTGVIDGSVSVYVQTNTGNQEWGQVQYLIDADPSDAVWQEWTDQNDISWVQFGDNINGLIPAQGLVIYATYRIGVGSAGNVAAGIVGEMVSSIAGVSVPYLSDGVTFNSTLMSGGADAETNDQIRANAAATYATQQRAVSQADFAAMALNVPGVSVASAVAAHSTSVSLYLLGPDYNPASTQLQDNVLTYFASRTLAGVTVTCSEPTLVPIDVGSPTQPMQLQVVSSSVQAVVLQNVQTALQALYQPPNVSFGQQLTVGEIYATVMAVAGVQWCVIPVFLREDAPQSNTNSISLRSFEIATPGTPYIVASGGI